jgi:hypothetical protein
MSKSVSHAVSTREPYVTISNELYSEWLLFNANPAISSYIMARYHGENKLVFNEVMMMSALY